MQPSVQPMFEQAVAEIGTTALQSAGVGVLLGVLLMGFAGFGVHLLMRSLGWFAGDERRDLLLRRASLAWQIGVGILGGAIVGLGAGGASGIDAGLRSNDAVVSMARTASSEASDVAAVAVAVAAEHGVVALPEGMQPSTVPAAFKRGDFDLPVDALRAAVADLGHRAEQGGDEVYAEFVQASSLAVSSEYGELVSSTLAQVPGKLEEEPALFDHPGVTQLDGLLDKLAAQSDDGRSVARDALTDGLADQFLFDQIGQQAWARGWLVIGVGLLFALLGWLAPPLVLRLLRRGSNQAT